jgi:hypothetical protein
MIERVARALALADLDPESRRAVNLDAHMAHVRGHYGELARAAIEAMKDPPFDILGAMFEAMFEDKWNGSQAPMIGAGWDAGIDAALNEHANAR